jgi:hypothetical protein
MGKKLICIGKTKFWYDQNGIPVPGPRFNEIVTVSGYANNSNYPTFEEYPGLGGYNSKYFKPLVHPQVSITAKELLEVEISN